MNKEQLKKCREEFRKWLIKWTNCEIQNGIVNGKKSKGGGWSCGTCTCDLLAGLGVKEDKQHNRPINRNNEVWRGILQLRGDKYETNKTNK